MAGGAEGQGREGLKMHTGRANNVMMPREQRGLYSDLAPMAMEDVNDSMLVLQ